MNLENRVVVMTGASRGLGLELAKAFAKQGAKVVMSARSKDELESEAGKLGALAVVADVSNESQVENLARKAVEKYGRIDVWVNNAGIRLPEAPFETVDFKRVHQLVETNLFGTMYGSKNALIQMKKQGSGAIVTILSTAALRGAPGRAAYVASKYATDGFIRSLRLELQAFNIRVLSVYPGGMRTHLFDEQKPADYEQYMDPAEVARKIVEHLEKENPEDELLIKRPSGRPV